MKVEQMLYTDKKIKKNEKSDSLTGKGEQLVLGFGAKVLLEEDDMWEIKKTLSRSEYCFMFYYRRNL
ncbi:MAG: hypothetical protein SGI96_11570 [Bacteroidota bacterium]|nr:hypothetical protein [Bacteroidota bacterium]